ncbi:hypothetical protein ACTFIV_010491 [Dictyostelium citrinum]
MSINSTFPSYKSEGWDKLSDSTLLQPGGVTAPFSIDALNLTIPKDKINETIRILDIAAGVGNLAIPASKEFPNSEIIATDYSKGMVDSLKLIIDHNKIKNVTTQVVDGQNMVNIESESFDYCFSIFGLIFFPNRLAGMKEMYRVLKSNNKSRTSISGWQPKAFLPLLLEKTYEQFTGGLKLTTKQPALALDDKDLFKSELEQAGFKNVEIHSVKHIIKFKDLEPILSPNNPVVEDFFKLIGYEDIDQFKEIFKSIANSLYPKDDQGYYLTEWNCYIDSDKPLINYIEPLTRNDNKLTVFGRFFGEKSKDLMVEIDGKPYNISEWTSSSFEVQLQPPNPKQSKIKVTTPINSVEKVIYFLNEHCLGIDVCNGHGVCVNGATECLCNEPWSGKDCSTISGESMVELMTKPTIYTSTKLNIFQIPSTPQNLQFNSSFGLVLKEYSKDGLILNTYLLTPSIQYGSIKGPDLQVYRYRTNTLISSSDQSFNCDVTLTHYQSNQTKSFYNQYINELKDSFALGVIINNFIPISPNNKLTLFIYPMIKSKKSFGGKLNTLINESNNKIDENDDGQYINGTTSVKMSIGTQKLRINLYNFGLFSQKFTTFNTSVIEIFNNTNYKFNNNNNSSNSISNTDSNNSSDDNRVIDNDIYSIISITSNSSKYIYFNADFYPYLDESENVDSSDKLTLFSEDSDSDNGSSDNNTKNIIDDGSIHKLTPLTQNNNNNKNNTSIDDENQHNHKSESSNGNKLQTTTISIIAYFGTVFIFWKKK